MRVFVNVCVMSVRVHVCVCVCVWEGALIAIHTDVCIATKIWNSVQQNHPCDTFFKFSKPSKRKVMLA